MKKEILDRIHEYAKEPTNHIGFTDGESEFERIVDCNESNKKLMNPTVETGEEYSNLLDLKNTKLQGIYTGSSEEWISVLEDDGFLPQGLDNTCICQIKPKKGIPIIEMERHKFLESGSEIDLTEEFLITDEPIPITHCNKLTKDEIKQVNQIVKGFH